MTAFTLLIMVVIVALIFDFVNGFHDTANAIATVVSTGVLRPRTAVLLAAVLNVAGAFHGTAVAKTIGTDILDASVVNQTMVLSALVSAVAWNLITWYFGIPSSSSHALLGGMLGAGVTVAGMGGIQAAGIEKAISALLFSPFAGFLAALVIMIALTWIVRRAPLPRINKIFRVLQIGSASLMAYSHGTNDAQKTMGIITMALLSYSADFAPNNDVPLWVVVSCAVAMGLGTAAGGWRIIHTLGSKIFKLRPIHGFAAETGAAVVLQVAAANGLPVSTTHCITAAIMGAGSTTRLSAVSWGVTRKILWAWILTIPVCALLSTLIYRALLAFGW